MNDSLGDENWMSRTKLLIGKDKINHLTKAHVLVVGLGGVGAYAAELLCRAGIRNLTLVDGDQVRASNRNRQLVALKSTEGKDKADVLAERLIEINPGVELNIVNEYVKDERMKEILKMASYDYVIDAIDTLSPKVFLIYHSIQNNLRIISSMGSGGKIDPSMVKIADISESYNCKLAYYIRKMLHKLNVRSGFKVVFSPETVPREAIVLTDELNKRSIVGTISYMPTLYGCYCASEVIRNLINE